MVKQKASTDRTKVFLLNVLSQTRKYYVYKRLKESAMKWNLKQNVNLMFLVKHIFLALKMSSLLPCLIVREMVLAAVCRLNLSKSLERGL